MASPFGIRFFTRGYDKTHREMASVEKQAKAINTGFARMGRTGAGVGPAMARGLGILRSGLGATLGVMKMFLRLTFRVGVALGVVGTAIAGVGVALSAKFVKGLMATRENFYLIETALTGVVKNAAQVRKISEWAMKYAAVFPAMYSDVMDAMKGLAMMPALKPIFTKASVADMEKIMNIVQGLAALDPQQGVKGALLAIREALAGQWRTLQMRFEIRPQAVASAAGLTMDELKNMPDKAIQALDAFVRLNVGADTLRKSAESLGVQWGNLSDQYEMWLNRVAQFGAYRTLVEFLLKLNDILFDIFKSDAAKRWGQDISRVFEGVILSIQSSITGIDWTGTDMFGGIVAAAKDIMKKVKDVFEDAKGMLTSAAQLLFAYMAKGAIITIKEVFLPVGKEIVRTILEGMVSEIDKHPIIAMLAAAFGGALAGGAMGGLGGGIVGAGAGVVALIAGFTKLEKSIKASKKATEEQGGESGWLGNLDQTIKATKNSLVEASKLFATKYGAMLPERKEITVVTPAEEQAKKVVEARSNLRLAELAGAKELVEVLKSQLAYEERLFEYHRKSVEWEADPKRGGREATLKKEVAGLKTELSKEIGTGKTFEQTETKRVELSKKEIEFTRLTKEKEKTLGDPKRYAGPELAQKAAAATEKEQNLKAKLLSTEKQINELKKEGGEEVSQLQDLEKKLISLSKQKVAIEKQYTNAKRQQLNMQKQIQMLETMRGGPEEPGISAMDRSKAMFQTFYKGFMEKRSVRKQFGQAEIPGAGGMTWAEGGTKSRERETRGIPQFMLKQEEQLRGKLATAESPEEKKMILEKLYQSNVEQFQTARGRTAKGQQFLEANEIQQQLQDVETQLLKEQIALAKEQAENIRATVSELITANKWLAIIGGGAGENGGGLLAREQGTGAGAFGVGKAGLADTARGQRVTAALGADKAKRVLGGGGRAEASSQGILTSAQEAMAPSLFSTVGPSGGLPPSEEEGPTTWGPQKFPIKEALGQESHALSPGFEAMMKPGYGISPGFEEKMKPGYGISPGFEEKMKPGYGIRPEFEEMMKPGIATDETQVADKAQLQDKQAKSAEEQASSVKELVAEMKTSNKLLAAISGNTKDSGGSNGQSALAGGAAAAGASVVSSFMNQINKVVWNPV